MTRVFLTTSEVCSKDEFAALREEWTDLLKRTRNPAIFHTWEWMYHWWCAFGGGLTLQILCVRDGKGVLRGLFPLYERDPEPGVVGMGRQLAYLGTGEPEAEEVATEYADILADKGMEVEVVHALWRYVGNTPWDQLRLPRVLCTSCIARYLIPLISDTTGNNVTVNPSGACYFVPLPSNWDEYLESLGKKRRKRVQNYRRRLTREGNFSYRTVVEPRDVDAALDTLARLHGVRWASRGKAGAFTGSRFRAFHRSVAKEFLALGWLDLRVWQFGGKDVAAFYGFRWENTLSYYQSGFDTTATGNVSLGMMSVMDTMEWAIHEGFQCFDFMGAREHSYKEDYECQTVPMIDVTIYNLTFRGIFHYVNRAVRDMAKGAIARVTRTPVVAPFPWDIEEIAAAFSSPEAEMLYQLPL